MKGCINVENCAGLPCVCIKLFNFEIQKCVCAHKPYFLMPGHICGSIYYIISLFCRNIPLNYNTIIYSHCNEALRPSVKVAFSAGKFITNALES